eukprot:7045062-Pyramimonas_sp.AAC.1
MGPAVEDSVLRSVHSQSQLGPASGLRATVPRRVQVPSQVGSTVGRRAHPASQENQRAQLHFHGRSGSSQASSFESTATDSIQPPA